MSDAEARVTPSPVSGRAAEPTRVAVLKEKIVSKPELAAPEVAANATLTRRSVLAAGGVLVATGLVSRLLPGGLIGEALAAEPTADELLKAGELPDIVVGKADAPVTIIEYASLTCGHCADFHTKVYPELKTKYIDTGKVRLILREFPLDNLAAAASMLVRCQEPAKAPEVISTLFEKRRDWIVNGNPLPPLFATVKPLGFTQEVFDRCVADQGMLQKIAAVRQRASQTFSVNSTPTFFINGTRLKGTATMVELDKLIEPLLPKG